MFMSVLGEASGVAGRGDAAPVVVPGALLARMDSLLADVKRNPKRYFNVKVF